MNRIEFKICKVAGAGEKRDQIMPFIDGKSLLAMLKKFERKQRGYFAKLAGMYSGHWILNEKDLYKEATASQILVCSCGEAGCGGVCADIIFESDKVVWKNIQDPGLASSATSRLDYSKFPVFEFDREQYEQALSDLITATAKIEGASEI